MLTRVTILIALALLLAPGAAAHAGDMDGVNCGDLPESDCQILLDNAAIMDEVFSAAFDMTMEMGVSGDSNAGDMQLSVIGDGRLAADPALATELMALDAATEADSMFALVEELFAAIQGEVVLNMTGASADEPLDMTLNLLIKDGVIVLNAGAMETVTGESMNGMEWFGFDTSGALGGLLGEAGMGSIADMSGMSSPAMEEAEAQATTIARLPDEQVAGIPVAVFESSIDLNPILSSLTLEDIQAEAGADQAADAEMALALTQRIEAREMSSRHYIGIDDRFTHRMDLVMDLTIGSEFAGLGEGELHLTANIDIYLSAFNQPVAVEIPEEAMVIPLAMMMQMGSQ
ncbi:MAG: hypothetical protein OXG23_11130 [Chloroflexi bacterium]|nr:hypothetical protein [Chloroflexota bacterium]